MTGRGGAERLIDNPLHAVTRDGRGTTDNRDPVGSAYLAWSEGLRNGPQIGEVAPEEQHARTDVLRTFVSR